MWDHAITIGDLVVALGGALACLAGGIAILFARAYWLDRAAERRARQSLSEDC